MLNKTNGRRHRVSIGAPAAARVESEARTEVAVEIYVNGRWDALALSKLLIPFHSFLVQHTAERWVVHARAPGCRAEPLAEALRAIEEWQTERRLDASVQIAPRRAGGARYDPNVKEKRWNA
jgi:hypothetical protein